MCAHVYACTHRQIHTPQHSRQQLRFFKNLLRSSVAEHQTLWFLYTNAWNPRFPCSFWLWFWAFLTWEVCRMPHTNLIHMSWRLNKRHQRLRELLLNNRDPVLCFLCTHSERTLSLRREDCIKRRLAIYIPFSRKQGSLQFLYNKVILKIICTK